jgi:hypothetical protein
MLDAYDLGDRVYVRWYGGCNMPCVVSKKDGEKRVQEEVKPGVGAGKHLRVGEKDVVEDPKSWGVTARRRVEKENHKSYTYW